MANHPLRRTVRAPGLSPAFPTASLWHDWRTLCEKIGERRAGSEGERQAADFIARRLGQAGLPRVEIESFPCTSLRHATVKVHEPRGRRWHRVEAVTLVGAPGTPGGRPVAGDLAWIESPAALAALQPGSLRGKILALFSPMPTSAAGHRRLLAAAPLVVIHIDERLPFGWTKNDGVYPYWVRTYGMLPTITVPYLEAWRWRRDEVRRLRISVGIEQVMAQSQNVIAELPGTARRLPALVIAAHHDTQCGNPGADDNASGVVCLLALARSLAGRRLRRTVRFISFGAEEQLSVGAAAYVQRHGITAAEVGLVLNFDSVASPLGRFIAFVAGSSALIRFARPHFADHGVDLTMRPEITPFADHFAFNRAGVPSLWFMRTNFPGGRWQHHSHHDTLENVSVAQVQHLLRATHVLAADLAARSTWPFRSRLPAAQQAEANRVGRNCLGPGTRAPEAL